MVWEKNTKNKAKPKSKHVTGHMGGYHFQNWGDIIGEILRFIHWKWNKGCNFHTPFWIYKYKKLSFLKKIRFQIKPIRIVKICRDTSNFNGGINLTSKLLEQIIGFTRYWYYEIRKRVCIDTLAKFNSLNWYNSKV